MKPLFTIVIPTRNREFELRRALHSVQGQTFLDFECIVVDDASAPRYDAQLLVHLTHDGRFKYIRLEKHSQRCIARNTGMRAAKGDWVVWLDSDDELAGNYLEAVRDAIVDYPDAKCFNFGAIVMHRRQEEDDQVRYTGTSIRPTFQPVWLGKRHKGFRAGKIGAGSFVFHRDVLDEIEWLPESIHFDQVHKMATDLHHLYPYPGPPIGNPWGDDYIMFYRITRKFQSIPLPVALYIQHVRV